MLHGFIRGLSWLVMHTFSRIKIIGKENIETGNVIYVCNHQSMVDAFINFFTLPSKTNFMAKKELGEIWAYKILFPRVKIFTIDRSKVDLPAIRHACEILKKGENLCIFPQGTRCNGPVIEPGQMHNGVGMIAMKNNSKVIPLMYPRKPALFHKNVLLIGKAIDLSEFEGQRPNNDTMTRFMEKVRVEMNALLQSYTEPQK